MKLSKGQQEDLETVMYFIPSSIKHIPITDRDIEMFFENSEKGLHKEQSHVVDWTKATGFHVLLQGKRWRGINIHELWEKGVLEGTIPYWTLLGGEDRNEIPPRSVVDFMKKEMFKGQDAGLIESVYLSIV